LEVYAAVIWRKLKEQGEDREREAILF